MLVIFPFHSCSNIKFLINFIYCIVLISKTPRDCCQPPKFAENLENNCENATNIFVSFAERKRMVKTHFSQFLVLKTKMQKDIFFHGSGPGFKF